MREQRANGRASWRTTASLLFVLAVLSLAAAALAQVPPPPGGPPPPGPLRVFLDWPGADLEIFRGQLTFAVLVASREEADVRVLVAPAPDGTDALVLSFSGLGRFAGDDNTLIYGPKPGEKPEDIRDGVARLAKIGLVRYVAKTPAAKHVTVEFQDQVKPTSVVDKWHFWVFNLGLDQFMMGETQYANTSSSGSFSANRVTPDLKVRTSFYGNLNRQRFDVDGTSYKSDSHGYGFEGLIVKSLGEHWSAGAYLSVSSSTYSNIKFGINPAPAVEYDVFRYSESTRRQLRFLYKLGYTYAVFHEVTIYDKTRQGLFSESLSATLELKQPWGTAEVGLEGSHYFYKPFKYRLQLGAEASIRVWKGLSFTVDGQFAKIHDQLALSAQGATPEEILLMLRELETDYQYFFSVGLNFRFGSLKSNIVNPRFGSGSRSINISF